MGKQGFSLIELLVVIAILAVLAALLFPVFARSKETAKLSQCQQQLRQAALGIQMYRADHDDRSWLILSLENGGATTAGRWRYPWNSWEPGAPYIKDSRLIWCPEPLSDPDTLFNLSSYRTIAVKAEGKPDVRYIHYPISNEPGRVVAFCSNHSSGKEPLPPKHSSSHSFRPEGRYLVAREDGSTKSIDARQIVMWYWGGADHQWHETEPPADDNNAQVWRFPGEPWPPSAPGTD